jgi:Zn-dependent protease/predicted transcriptional regulator
MSFSIGKIFGVKIKLHFTWFFIFALIAWTLAAFYLPDQYPGLTTTTYWILGAISALLLFASVLVHELAHSYVAIKRGMTVPSITLFLFGGVSELETEPEDPKTEAQMSIVGPLTSFGIAGLAAAAWYAAIIFNLGAILEAPLFYIALINVLLGAFNLLPAFPLDGGRFLRSAIWRWKKDLISATKIATKIGKGFAYAIIGFGFFIILAGNLIGGIWFIFIGWFLRSGADQSLKQTIINNALSNVDVKDIMTKEVVTISPEKTLSDATTDYFNVYKHGGFPVVQNNEVVGIFTISDLKNISENERFTKTVGDVMTPKNKLIFLKSNESGADAFMKFSKNEIGRLPVLEDNTLIGIVSRSDVFRIVRIKTDQKV